MARDSVIDPDRSPEDYMRVLRYIARQPAGKIGPLVMSWFPRCPTEAEAPYPKDVTPFTGPGPVRRS